MSLGNAFKHDAVYTGQQIIDFLKEAEDQYADKINMIEAQRQVAMNDAVALRVEYGKVLRQAARLEQQLKDSESARIQTVENYESLQAEVRTREELTIPAPPEQDHTLSLFADNGVTSE